MSPRPRSRALSAALGAASSALLTVAFLVPTTRAQAQAPVPAGMVATPIPAIAVSGLGEEQVTPDRARVQLGVQTRATTAADAAARNARLQKAVLDTLKGIGIAADQIRTSGYNVFPDQQYDPQTRTTKLVGYVVSNTVIVEVRKMEQVGPVLDAVLSKGANTVSSLQFYSSDAEGAHRRALAKAVERARTDAEAMAAAAGGRLGELLELSSGEGFRPQPLMEMAMARGMAAGAAPPTPIMEGTQTIAANVSARWRFVPGR